ncbi:hypothetical protein NP493_928g01031 [Ridgeia piscesae]|uniref:Reverse transcriptase domain-containing protein n=1 Tax=Ridgeia piscesae TaxID=27915 RepID=A0AAD9KJL0_RIDPI|nr:hypothetical protein NP493_928g01031 [Ridgeia piscesae]
MKGFYNGLKEVWGPKKKGPAHLISTEEMKIFFDSKRVVARWSEHFQKLFNVPGDIDHEALENIPQRMTKTSLDDIPTMAEMARAITGLQDGKASGGDGIPAEVWKHGGDNLFSRLHQLITNAWEVGSVPQSWKDASIVTIYKKAMLDEALRYTGMASTYSPDRALTYSMSHISELDYSDTDTRELLFADDSALVAEEIQKIVDAFSNASKSSA